MSAAMALSMRKRPLPQESRTRPAFAKRPRHNAVSADGTLNIIPNALVYGSETIASVISSFATLLAQGESGAPSVQMMINNMTPEMLADIVIANMVHFPRSRDPRVIKQMLDQLQTDDRSVEPVNVESISDRPSLPVPRSGKSLAKRVLSDDQKGALCIASLVRILLQKHNTITGGKFRNALLARLAVDITEFLQVLESRILADYEAGHELGLHVLYQLYADQPTLYDEFLLSLARGLQDKISKSLSRLLTEAPVVSTAAFTLLEELCTASKAEHVTTGLTALWSLIMHRPPLRDACLKLVLKCTVHESVSTREKAVRLVANKLYPLHYVAESIQDFATKTFHSVVNPRNFVVREESSGDQQTSDDVEAKRSEVEVSLPEAQRSMSLFFALCVKKHALLWKLFDVYEKSPEAVKQTIDKHIAIIVRTIGSSSQELLQVIAFPPTGSDNLVKQVQTILSKK